MLVFRGLSEHPNIVMVYLCYKVTSFTLPFSDFSMYFKQIFICDRMTSFDLFYNRGVASRVAEQSRT